MLSTGTPVSFEPLSLGISWVFSEKSSVMVSAGLLNKELSLRDGIPMERLDVPFPCGRAIRDCALGWSCGLAATGMVRVFSSTVLAKCAFEGLEKSLLGSALKYLEPDVVGPGIPIAASLRAGEDSVADDNAVAKLLEGSLLKTNWWSALKVMEDPLEMSVFERKETGFFWKEFGDPCSSFVQLSAGGFATNEGRVESKEIILVGGRGTAGCDGRQGESAMLRWGTCTERLTATEVWGAVTILNEEKVDLGAACCEVIWPVLVCGPWGFRIIDFWPVAGADWLSSACEGIGGGSLGDKEVEGKSLEGAGRGGGGLEEGCEATCGRPAEGVWLTGGQFTKGGEGMAESLEDVGGWGKSTARGGGGGRGWSRYTLFFSTLG
jgi:hypothetical protein